MSSSRAGPCLSPIRPMIPGRHSPCLLLEPVSTEPLGKKEGSFQRLSCALACKYESLASYSVLFFSRYPLPLITDSILQALRLIPTPTPWDFSFAESYLFGYGLALIPALYKQQVGAGHGEISGPLGAWLQSPHRMAGPVWKAHGSVRRFPNLES